MQATTLNNTAKFALVRINHDAYNDNYTTAATIAKFDSIEQACDYALANIIDIEKNIVELTFANRICNKEDMWMRNWVMTDLANVDTTPQKATRKEYMCSQVKLTGIIYNIDVNFFIEYVIVQQ